MPKLSDFDVSFDPENNDEEKKRGIEFWHKYITLIRPLQKNKALNLKTPKQGILDFLATRNALPFSPLWKPFEGNDEQLSIDEFNVIKRILNKILLRKALVDTYFSKNRIGQIIEVMKKHQWTLEEVIDLTRRNFQSRQKNLQLNVSTKSKEQVDDVSSENQKSQATPEYKEPDKSETWRAIKDEDDDQNRKEDPNFRAVEDEKNLQIDKETKKPLSIPEFANVGPLAIDPERCVADWKINGNYEHEFRRCKPHGEIEYDKEGQYGWKTPEPFVERFRQDTVFGVPVVFSQNMVFDQQTEDLTKEQEKEILNCALFICSKMSPSFVYDKTRYFDYNRHSFNIANDKFDFFIEGKPAPL